MKILAISGMDSGRDSPTRSRSFANAFLLKPFKVDALLATVSKLLASETPAG